MKKMSGPLGGGRGVDSHCRHKQRKNSCKVTYHTLTVVQKYVRKTGGNRRITCGNAIVSARQ